MRSLNRMFMASAALLCLGTAQAVAGGPPDPYPNPGFAINIMGGGATFPSVVYRQIMDCAFHPLGYGNTTGPGPLTINTYCPSAPFGEASGKGYLWMYYAPVGSGNGKATIKTNNNATLTNPITTTLPYTSSQIPVYPWGTANGYHFSGSDDVWNLADQTTWTAAGGPQSKYGNLIQLPGVAGSVTVFLNGKDGGGTNLTQNGAAVTGSSSAINLTRQAVCGIFSGHITKWSNTILMAQNGGVAMGSGQITVVHRFDGSGTNFLLTNGLQQQCRAVTGPNNETDTTIVSYAFPWTDHQTACPNLPRGSNQVNWPDQFGTVCTLPNTAPTGSVYTFPQSGGVGISGSQAVVNTVAATNGAIGYVSPDFTKMAPTNPTGPITANLQNEWDVSTNITTTPTFVAATVAATQAAMSSVTPVFDSTSRGEPLAWSLQGVVPDPTLQAAYPLAGFSWIELYQCYNSPANVPAQFLSFIYGLYTASGTIPAPGVQAIIESNGFAQVPGVWQSEAYKLLNDPNLQPGNTTDASSKCHALGVVGAT
jgi:phosphate transport system substrate-binding protein